MTIQVKKIGVNFNPSPTLLLLYSEGGKARRREMPLRDLRKDSDCRTVAARLRLRHSRHLASLPEVRVERLIMVAREHLGGASLSDALTKVDELMAVDPSENLNALSDAELQRRKDLMQLKFERNSVGKEHPDYIYDKVADFGGGLKEPAKGWDSDSDQEQTPKVEVVKEIVKEDQYDDDEFSVPEDEDEDEDFW